MKPIIKILLCAIVLTFAISLHCNAQVRISAGAGTIKGKVAVEMQAGYKYQWAQLTLDATHYSFRKASWFTPTLSIVSNIGDVRIIPYVGYGIRHVGNRSPQDRYIHGSDTTVLRSGMEVNRWELSGGLRVHWKYWYVSGGLLGKEWKASVGMSGLLGREK